jgi:monoamine oxidase
MDLEPSWFWHGEQKLMRGAIADFGLNSFPQFEDRDFLRLTDPDAAPGRTADEHVGEGAFRLRGGIATLVYALARAIPILALHLNHALVGLRDQGDHLRLSFAVGSLTKQWETRHVVPAPPPRLFASDIRFEPELDESTCEAPRSAPTRMAARAKGVIACERPFWREAGRSGEALVAHEQAVLGETFDACEREGRGAALGDFVALSSEQRESFRVGLPLLVESQIIQLFGQGGGNPEIPLRDWAEDSLTRAALDREGADQERVDVANPLLRQAKWGSKLRFGGAETAARHAGLLEGALQAARRIERDLVSLWGRDGDKPERQPLALADVNGASIARFEAWVAAEGNAVFDDYRRRLHAGLAARQHEQLTQRALLGAMEGLFAKALAELETLGFNAIGVSVEHGRSSLTPCVREPFRAIMATALDDVIVYNRASCALSNFPDEHRLSKPYVQVILRDIAAAWREFSLAVNRLLLVLAAGSRTDAA